MTLDEYTAANRDNWDDRVPIHVASKSYDLPAIIAGGSSLHAVDLAEMGDVRGKRLLHLQCHIGHDTVSWARQGARITGLDFSAPAIEAARSLADACGIEARFVVSDVYAAPEALGGEQFDIVYTGVGALPWLPDVRRWARVVAACLAPGGRFYIREGHPMLYSLDDEREDDALVVEHPYFETETPQRWEFPWTYTDGEARLEHPVTYEWNHGLGEVVTALIDAGLRIEFVHEHRFIDWKALPSLVGGEDGMWRLPEHGERLPLMYSIRASRPA